MENSSIRSVLAILLILLTSSCDLVRMDEKKFIREHLPGTLLTNWRKEAVDKECERIVDVFVEYGNGEINRYSEEWDADYLRQCSFWGGLYALTHDGSDKKEAVSRYKAHCEDVIAKWREGMKLALDCCEANGEDISYMRGWTCDDSYYCKLFLGTPEKIPDDIEADEGFDSFSQQMAYKLAIDLLKAISKPIIASTTYDRDFQQWVVRLEGMNDKRVYVKAYRRDDGKKDYQYREDAPLENKY